MQSVFCLTRLKLSVILTICLQRYIEYITVCTDILSKFIITENFIPALNSEKTASMFCFSIENFLTLT